jgi:secreted trypsin-like serine protease
MRFWSSLVLVLALASSACVAAEQEDPTVGEDSVAIVGGALTNLYQAVPAIYSEFADGTGSLCSGTLISPRVVLTAAHCVSEFPSDPTVHVVYFGTDFQDEADPNHLATINVAEYEYHPNWNINDLEGGHDIALLLLEQAGPVPPLGYNRVQLDGRTGEDVHLVGWGRTDGTGNDYGVKREVMSSLTQQSPLLMQYGSPTANTCQGDSGGPNFMTQDGTEVVAGITSFGNVGCDQYGVGTNVAFFASSYIDPYLTEKDGGGCLANSTCNSACGEADPDCADGGDDTGDGDGDGDGSGDGSGGNGSGGAPNAVQGSCSAAGGAGSGSGLAALFLLAALVRVNRRRRR